MFDTKNEKKLFCQFPWRNKNQINEDDNSISAKPHGNNKKLEPKNFDDQHRFVFENSKGLPKNLKTFAAPNIVLIGKYQEGPLPIW